MSRISHIVFWLLFLCIGGGKLFAVAPADSIPKEVLVFVEGYDEGGKTISRAVGIIIKPGYVAVNYHSVAGMNSISVFKPGEAKEYKSTGYLSVEEEKDIIIITAPGLFGRGATLNRFAFPEDGTSLTMTELPQTRSLKFASGKLSGKKELLNIELPQLLSSKARDCTSGPVFREKEVVGFVTAGYLDDRYYSYIMPIKELRRIMNRSFIIKDYNSLSDEKPMGSSYYQKNLLENLTAVLWLSFPDAERMARQKGKMMIVSISTNWAGWSKLMDKNTFSSKRIIRYVNENYYAVKFDAESIDTVVFNKLAYHRNIDSDYHGLAYSLLEGKMDFPSTVFLDEDVNLLMAIPGYMTPEKLEVVLHYFNERAYKNEQLSFQQFEMDYWKRKNRY